MDKIECGLVSICVIDVFICLNKNYFKQKSIVTRIDKFFSLFLIKVFIFLNKLFVCSGGIIRRGFFYLLNLFVFGLGRKYKILVRCIQYGTSTDLSLTCISNLKISFPLTFIRRSDEFIRFFQVDEVCEVFF